MNAMSQSPIHSLFNINEIFLSIIYALMTINLEVRPCSQLLAQVVI